MYLLPEKSKKMKSPRAGTRGLTALCKPKRKKRVIIREDGCKLGDEYSGVVSKCLECPFWPLLSECIEVRGQLAKLRKIERQLSGSISQR